MSPGRIAQIIATLKRGPSRTAVATEPASGVRLAPVARDDLADAELIERLAAWRRQHADRYPTRFEVTFEGTRTWLRDRVLDAPARLLFLLVPPDESVPAGHLGFDRGLRGDGTIELINLVRGDRERIPDGAMERCIDAAIGWAADELGVAAVWGTPFSDNLPAIHCLEAAGFAADELLPLRRHVLDGRVEYRLRRPEDAAPADRHWLHMTHRVAR